MPTILGRKYSTEWQGKPPRMSTEDYMIWIRYRDEATKNALWIFYDVGLGDGIEPEGEISPEIRQAWLTTTQKRADVIIQRPTVVDIVELRYSASVNAVGRLKLYMMLYRRDPVLGLNVRPVLVTNRRDRDVQDLCAQENIMYVVV